MKPNQSFTILSSLTLTLSALALQSGCSARPHDGTDRNVHFLTSCSTENDCGSGLECVCGVCTQSCTTNRDCRELDRGAVCESTTLLDQNCGAFSLICQDNPEPQDDNTYTPHPNPSNDHNTSTPASTHVDRSTYVDDPSGCTSEASTSGDWLSGVPSSGDWTSAPPRDSSDWPPIPPLDCSTSDVLIPNGTSEPTEAYTWDGNTCTRFVDTHNSAVYFTQADCEIAHVRCLDVPSHSESALVRFSNYPTNTFWLGLVSYFPETPDEQSNDYRDPTGDFSDWTEAEWVGWSEPQAPLQQCPGIQPGVSTCPSSRTLELLVAGEILLVSVDQLWLRPATDYMAPEQIKFRVLENEWQYGIEIVDASDDSLVLLMIHSFPPEGVWKFGNFQAHHGAALAHDAFTTAAECPTEEVWTSTLVSFHFDDGQSPVKQAFSTQEEVELAPFESTVLTDPTTGHAFDITAGLARWIGPGNPNPPCPSFNTTQHYQNLFAYRLR